MLYLERSLNARSVVLTATGVKRYNVAVVLDRNGFKFAGREAGASSCLISSRDRLSPRSWIDTRGQHHALEAHEDEQAVLTRQAVGSIPTGRTFGPLTPVEVYSPFKRYAISSNLIRPTLIFGVEHERSSALSFKQVIVGSLPINATKFARVAQLDERSATNGEECWFDPSREPQFGVVGEFGRPRFPVTEENAGSNPVGSASFLSLSTKWQGNLILNQKMRVRFPARDAKFGQQFDCGTYRHPVAMADSICGQMVLVR